MFEKLRWLVKDWFVNWVDSSEVSSAGFILLLLKTLLRVPVLGLVPSWLPPLPTCLTEFSL